MAAIIEFPQAQENMCESRQVDVMCTDGEVRARPAFVSSSGRVYEQRDLLRPALYGGVIRGVVLEFNEQTGFFTRRMDMLVAIKVVSRQLLAERRAAARPHEEDPEREMAAMTFMSEVGGGHRNVVRQLEYMGDNENIYSVMPLYTGGEFFDVVAGLAQENRTRGVRAALGEDQARDLFGQILEGTAYMHDLGVAHRDMSLENLLVDGDGRTVVIIDMGMSVRVPSDPDTGEPLLLAPRGCFGKRSYISPEVALSTAPFDPFKSDVWALGVILFIMLAGFPPMVVALAQDAHFGYVREGRLRWLIQQLGVNMSPAAQDLLEHMLRVDPAQRPTVAQLRTHPWITGQQA